MRAAEIDGSPRATRERESCGPDPETKAGTLRPVRVASTALKFGPVIFRLTAILLLLSAAVDVVGVDVLGRLWHGNNAAQTTSCSDTDECYCCCGHFVIPARIQLRPMQSVFSTQPLDEPKTFAVQLAPPFRPPRA